MKKNTITIWPYLISGLLASLIALPAYAITTSEKLIGSVKHVYGDIELLVGSDVLATSVAGRRLNVMTYDSATGQVKRWKLAQEQSKIYLDFLVVEPLNDGSAFVAFKYQADPVLHYNVWNGSSWDYATTQYQTFACGTSPQFDLTSIDNRIVLTYRTTNCLIANNGSYQALREYNIETKQWTDLDLNQVDPNTNLDLITKEDAIFVGKYYYIGINYPNPPTSFLYVWRRDTAVKYLELPLHTHTFASKQLQAYSFRYFFEQPDGVVAIAGNESDSIIYESTNRAYYNVRKNWPDDQGDGNIDVLDHAVATDNAALDLRNNLIMLIDDDTPDQLYRWDGSNFEWLELDLNDGATGVYAMTTLSDGRIFILAYDNTYHYALTWDGIQFSTPERFNKNYTQIGFDPPDIILNYSDKPYVVITYDGGNDVRIRGWDNGILQPVVIFKRGNTYFSAGEAYGRFGLISVIRGNYIRRRFWDNVEHRFVASYTGKSFTVYEIYQPPQQISATLWQTLEYNLHLNKTKGLYTKLRLFTTRFD